MRKIQSPQSVTWTIKKVRIFFVPLFFLSACTFSLAQDIAPPTDFKPTRTLLEPSIEAPVLLYPLVSSDPASGKKIFEQQCAICHGLIGMGDGDKADDLPNPVAPIGDPTIVRRAIPRDWFLLITEGKLEKYMPPFQSLTERQRWDVIAYIFRLATTPENVHMGEKLYQSYCADCHGEEGRGGGVRVPEIDASKLPDFQNMAYMSNIAQVDFFQVISEGQKTSMPAYKDQLSEDERWAIADFIRTFSFYSDDEQVSETFSTESLPTKEIERNFAKTPLGQTQEPSQTNFQSPGIISGVVKNLSGGSIPVGGTVTLHAFDQMQLVYTDTVSINEAGSFDFQNVEVMAGLTFIASIEYEGAIFGSDLAVVGSDNQIQELIVEIYETTTDTASLSVDRLHYFFEFFDDQAIQVVELYVISNSSNKTLVSASEDQPVLHFTLPQGASNLEFQDGVLGGRYVLMEEGFGDFLPVRPGLGQHQIMFSYQIPFNRKLEFDRPMILKTDAIVILVPEESITIKGDGIQDVGTRDVQGVLYRMYNGDRLDAGEQINLEITGRTSTKIPGLTTDLNSESLFGLSALGVALIVASVWLYLWRHPRNNILIENENTIDEFHIENADTIMDAILTLDDLFQQDKLPEDAYIKRRAELKTRLVELLDETKE